jgi:hypothetical protein
VGEVGVKVFFCCVITDVTQGLEPLKLFVGDTFRSSISVNIDELRMLRCVAVVLETWIRILDQVVPEMPFPDNASSGGTKWPNLKDAVGPESCRARPIWLSSGLDGLLPGLVFPRDEQDIAIGQGFDIVMLKPLFGGENPVPGELSIPVELLDSSPLPTSMEGRGIRLPGAAQQVPVVK